MDPRFLELMPAAIVAAQHCMKVQPGQEILIVTDTRVGEYTGGVPMVSAVLAAVAAAGGEPQMVVSTPRGAHADLSRTATAAMRAADGIFILMTASAGHSAAVREICTQGGRAILLGAGTMYQHTDRVYRLMPRSGAELHEVGALTRKLAEILLGGRQVRITSARGTDFSARLGERRTFCIDGIARPGDLQMLPPGVVVAGVNPGTAHGRVVIDGSLGPFERPLSEPVTLTVERGHVRGVEGGAEAVEWKAALQNLNDPGAGNIAEIGIGTHPRARLSGVAMEDVRLYGGYHLGIGSDQIYGGVVRAAWHVDVNALMATVDVDSVRILEDGRFLI